MTSLGARFAAAVPPTRRSAPSSRNVDFGASRVGSGGPPGRLVTVLPSGSEPQDPVDDLVEVVESAPSPTRSTSYRPRITTPDGPTRWRQAYYRAEGDRIGYLRVLCSDSGRSTDGPGRHRPAARQWQRRPSSGAAGPTARSPRSSS